MPQLFSLQYLLNYFFQNIDIILNRNIPTILTRLVAPSPSLVCYCVGNAYLRSNPDRVVNMHGTLRRRLARPTVRLMRTSPRKIYMSHRPVACRSAMRYPTAVAVEIVSTSNTGNNASLHRIYTCCNLLFIERMNLQLYPPNISCIRFCSALATRKFITSPGDKYLKKKLLLNVDCVITLCSIDDDRNAYVRRA